MTLMIATHTHIYIYIHLLLASIYEATIAGVHFSLLSWIITGLSYIIKAYLPKYDSLSLIAFYFAHIPKLIGICCFYSNIVNITSQALQVSSQRE